jgi:hypothetical protein
MTTNRLPTPGSSGSVRHCYICDYQHATTATDQRTGPVLAKLSESVLIRVGSRIVGPGPMARVRSCPMALLLVLLLPNLLISTDP